MQVLYLKMIHTDGLLSLAENSVDTNDLEAAKNYIERALTIEPQRPDLNFLHAIIYYRQHHYNLCAQILEGMVMSGNSDHAVISLLEEIRWQEPP